MRKKSLIALLLALALMLSGCALVAVDEAKDMAQTIIDVDGETVNKQLFMNQVNYYFQQQYDQYTQYGLEDYFVQNQSSIVENLYQQVQQQNVKNLVMKHAAQKLGLDKMNAEEQAEIETEAKNQYYSLVAQTFLADSELTGDELRAEAEKYAADNSLTDVRGVTLDAILQDVTDQKTLQKLTHSVTDAVTVSEERLQSAMDATPDYRLVKHILIRFPDSSAVSSAKSAVTSAEANVTAAQAALDNAAEDADKDALTAALDDAKAALTEAQDALTALTAETLQKANDVYALATAEDADFDALIAEYNEDPGMESSPNGYLVSSNDTNFVTEFKNGAMALENVGDVSEPVESSYGYHIIRYTYDSAAAETRAAVSDSILANVQDEAMDAAYAEWEKASNIKTYLDRLN